MKSEKGITLISLTIYVIVMTLVVAVVGIVTGVFVKNIQKSSFYTDPIAEYTAFNSYFSDEVNHEVIKVLECKSNYVVFNNGIQYTFVEENKGIYRNKVKIARDIDFCTFSEQIKNGKQVINVNLKSGSQNRNTTYTLK